MRGSPGLAGGADSTQFARCRMHLHSFGRDLWDQHYGVYLISLAGFNSVCDRLGSVEHGWVSFPNQFGIAWDRFGSPRSIANLPNIQWSPGDVSRIRCIGGTWRRSPRHGLHDVCIQL